jgi:hypothetical protein
MFASPVAADFIVWDIAMKHSFQVGGAALDERFGAKSRFDLTDSR